jgi:preprotein translocase subunit YajC
MPHLSAAIPLLFAEAANPNPNGPTTSPLTYLPYLAMLGLWGYFLLFRPQQQQEKRRREMIAALKKNDKVLTSAGIYGTVVSIDSDADKVVLRVDDDRGVKVAFSKSAVVRVIDAAEKVAEPA